MLFGRILLRSGLNRRFRLRKSSDLMRVRREGQSFAHPLIVLQVSLNNLDYNRIGFVATRSIGNAVKRNKAKRLLREAVRSKLNQIKLGYDLVFVARAPLLDSGYAKINDAVGLLIRRANLYRVN